MCENTAAKLIKLSRELRNTTRTTLNLNFQDVHDFLEELTLALERKICHIARHDGNCIAPLSFHIAKLRRIDFHHGEAIMHHLQTSDAPAFTALTEKLRELDIDAVFMVTYGPDGDRTKNTNGYLLKVVFLLDQPFKGRPSTLYGYA